MAFFGNCYWPDGFPKGSSNVYPYGERNKYHDSEGNHFWICYTEDQIIAQYEKMGAFCPYFPLMVCGPPPV
jgi:hypothetical protein